MLLTELVSDTCPSGALMSCLDWVWCPKLFVWGAEDLALGFVREVGRLW